MHDFYFYSTDLIFFSTVGSGLQLHAPRHSGRTWHDILAYFTRVHAVRSIQMRSRCDSIDRAREREPRPPPAAPARAQRRRAAAPAAAR